jgi:putative transposase
VSESTFQSAHRECDASLWRLPWRECCPRHRFSYPRSIQSLIPQARIDSEHGHWVKTPDPMPRQARIDLPGVRQHLDQRGNDRRPCFLEPIDRTRCLDELRGAASRNRCASELNPPAYVLKTHHVHLLLTPAATGCVSAMMLGWGAATSATSMIATAAPAPVGKAASRPARCSPSITCCAATATSNSSPSAPAGSANPAATSGRAMQQTRWARSTRSSAHPQYLALHAEDTAHQRRYRDWVHSATTPNEVAPDEVDEIRRRLQCQHAFGTERFRR